MFSHTALTVAAALSSLPPGFVPLKVPDIPTSGEAVATARCGAFEVQNVVVPAAAGTLTWPSSVRVLYRGKRVYRARGRQYSLEGARVRMSLWVDYCGDLTGDGIPELVMTERTHGMSCCYTHYVVSMTSPATTRLIWDKGPAGHGIRPIKLRPGKRWQLISKKGVSPPGEALSSKQDPFWAWRSTAFFPFFPIVFHLEKGHYRKRTFTFARHLDALHKNKTKPFDVLDWGAALIRGDWKNSKERAQLQQSPDDAARLAAFDRYARSMQLRLVKQLGY